ncbi:hypothetical protein ACOMICROBIO_LKFPLAJE_00960 [Vibrio sp. B1FIG11]|nr:hypothetical protein ACOMICROBIO_LKFPLAJE_00960 [Vibrio sp. B1FIG11]
MLLRTDMEYKKLVQSNDEATLLHTSDCLMKIPFHLITMTLRNHSVGISGRYFCFWIKLISNALHKKAILLNRALRRLLIIQLKVVYAR